MTGKPEFNEGHHPNFDPAGDTHSAGAYGFDWEGLFASIGEGDAMLEPEDFERMAVALRAVFRFVIGEDMDGRGATLGKNAVRRLLVLLWVTDPGYFADKPSLTALAKRMGVHKVSLSKHAAQATRVFGVKNKFQTAHDWRKGNK